jgi:hypothetical protein
MIRLARLALAVAAAAAGHATVVQAQLRPRQEARAGANRQLAQKGQGNRAQLERQFQQTLYQMTRRRVGLTDEQMRRLVPINQRFEMQRRAIQRQERETRLALRDAMRDSTSADQTRISGYVDKLIQLQRQRVDLVEQEQRDLAQVMSPLQRARYMALQEQVRRRVEQLRRQKGAVADTARPAPPGG